MNRYEVLSICLALFFIILLFSGLTYSSELYGVISLWVIILSGLIGLKGHFIKKPDLIVWKKVTYSLLIFAGILLSALIIFSEQIEAPSSMSTKFLITAFNGLIILLAGVKLITKWYKLSRGFIASAFVAIVVLLVSILFIWVR